MAFTTDALRVEVAWSTVGTLAASPAWEDMTSLVALEQGISWNRGRPDSQSQVSSGQFTFALRNDGGEYTPGNMNSGHYPNVVLGRRARLTYRTPSSSGNFLGAEDASFEGGTVGNWTGSVIGFAAATVANSTAFAQVGTHSLQVTWGTGSSSAGVFVAGLVIGRSYTATAYVYVPAGSPQVSIDVYGIGLGTNTGATTGAFVRLTKTFTATGSSHFIDVQATGPGTAYVDAVQVDEAVGTGVFSTSAAPVATRFDGSINAIDARLITTGALAFITATDLLKQVGENGPFRSILGEEILYDTPAAYWPLGESTTSTSAGDVSGSSGIGSLAPVQLGSGGTVAFGAGTGPQYDGQAAVVFTPASVGNGLYLQATGSPNLTNNANGVFATTFEAFVNTNTAATQVIARLIFSTTSYLSLEVTAASKLLVTLVDHGTTMGSVTSANNVTGGTKHVAATISLSSGTATLTAYLDGSSAGTATWTQPSGYLYYFDTLQVGGTPSGSLLTGTVSHVAFNTAALSSSRISIHRNAGLTGFIGEMSGTRVARLLRLAGVPTALTNVEAGLSTIDYQDTTGAAPQSAISDVVTAERGVFFPAADGRLTFHGRSHRYNAASVATFDADADLGNPELSTLLNDQLLINDVTGNRPGGATQRAVNSQSVAANGLYATTVTLIVDSDNLAANIVQSIANTYSVPSPRAPELPIDILTVSQSQAAAALALDVGSLITVTNLPASAPSTTLNLFVEGVSETVGPGGWDIKLATSPATYTAVWILDSATYSQLDSTTILSL